MKFDSGAELIDLGDGVVCEKDVLGIVEKIRAYDPRLDVIMLDPHDPRMVDFTDAPYMICEVINGIHHRICEVWKLDESVYERVIQADTKRFKVLGRIEENDRRIREENTRRFREERESARDIMAHLMASPKTSYSFKNDRDEVVTIDSHLGVVKRK